MPQNLGVALIKGLPDPNGPDLPNDHPWGFFLQGGLGV